AMKSGAPGRGKHPGTLSCGAPPRARGHGHPALLLALLGLLGMPVARGDCGPPPHMTHSRPSSDTQASSFPVGSRVTYTCTEGAIKIPGRSDTVQCLPSARWSKLLEPCGRSCGAPTRLRFAALSKEDERINFFPVGSNVSYVCRPGFENTSESSPTSTCLENLVWSEAAELCRRRSCGAPAALPGGGTVVLTDLQFEPFCIFIIDLQFLAILTLTFFPAVITCSSPPQVSNGKHDGQGAEEFPYNSTVTYSCDSGFELVGNVSIRCTSTDRTNGVWSGAVPECKGGTPKYHLFLPLFFCLQDTRSVLEGSFGVRGGTPWLFPLLFPCFSSVSRTCTTSAFRFVVPLYKTPNYYSPGTSQGSVCLPKYMGISGILPQAGCFENLKRSKVASFCGSE
uniref:CD55 molecule (Cromer blood group) n=1 Tax=Athene cunicularia TaxID=194338 RepID=A0A663MBZ4_ATHCN